MSILTLICEGLSFVNIPRSRDRRTIIEKGIATMLTSHFYDVSACSGWKMGTGYRTASGIIKFTIDQRIEKSYGDRIKCKRKHRSP